MGRIIAVGDRNQAIYGFRGAHHGSMDELKDRFHCVELPLSISYRCPRAVVERAKAWVPQIEAWEGAADGYVGESGTDWKAVSKLPSWEQIITDWSELRHFAPGDVILCRLTRPLVALAFVLIRNRIPCRVLGRDIGQGLTSLVKRVCKRARLEAQDDLGAFETALDEFSAHESEKLRQKGKQAELGRLEDQVATIRIFMQAEGGTDGLDRSASGTGDARGLAGAQAETVADLIADIERMFVDNGQARAGVVLSTVHKAKGLEWDRVFVLDAPEFMPWKWARQDWELQQEQNLMYVAATRSKRELRYVSSEELGVPGSEY